MCVESCHVKLLRAVCCVGTFVAQVSASFLMADMAEEDSPWKPYFE